MAQAAPPDRRPATWEDLDEVPETSVGEIVDGEVVVTPRPDPPHTDSASDLGALLGGPFRFGIGGPGGWVIRDGITRYGPRGGETKRSARQAARSPAPRGALVCIAVLS